MSSIAIVSCIYLRVCPLIWVVDNLWTTCVPFWFRNSEDACTFKDPSSNPAAASDPSEDRAQERAQGERGANKDLNTGSPLLLFHTYTYTMYFCSKISSLLLWTNVTRLVA